MKFPGLLPSLIFCASISLAFPASSSPSNSRLEEILRLPSLQSDDWHDLFSMAESGDPEAQYWLSRIYEQGKLLPLDKPKANFWLRKSAEHGYARAEYRRCAQSNMSDQFANEACLWRAAENGVPEAQFWLGTFFRDNRFGVTDEKLAFDWFRRAAEGDNVDAEVELGNHYETGDGVERDLLQAAYWFRRAAEHVPDLGGAGSGRNNLGILYEIGEGVPKDNVQAYMWLTLGHGNENIVRMERRMTPEEIAVGKRLAEDWKRGHPDPAIY